MLFLPTRKYLPEFNRQIQPLPLGLLPYLYSRGLGIYILPKKGKEAQRVAYDLLKLERTKKRDDGRNWLEIGHYNPGAKQIIIPYESFYNDNKYGTVLHEVGHAVDYLYASNGGRLSKNKNFLKAMRLAKPLDSHCKGAEREQFATAFSAFFTHKYDFRPTIYHHNIREITKGFIILANKYFVKPFKG